MSFGSDQWALWLVAEDKVLSLLKAAWDRGVTTIDTANIYSNGQSERIIGKFLKQNNILRHRVTILTKCYGIAHDDPGVKAYAQLELKNTRDYVNQGGLSRGAILNQIQASLERLGTSYIDLLQIHRFDPDTPPKETMRALHDLVQSSKVRYIGASSMGAWQFAELNHIAELNGWTQFVTMQSEYSLLYREDESEMIPYCSAHGIGLIPWGPLQAGDLAYPIATHTERRSSGERKYSEADKEIISRMEEIVQKRGWTMSQTALAWIGKKATSPIVGINSPERLEVAIITGKELTEEEVKYLEEPYVPKVVRGHT